MTGLSFRMGLGGPLRVADGAAVLILEILRIRLDVENVTGARV